MTKPCTLFRNYYHLILHFWPFLFTICFFSVFLLSCYDVSLHVNFVYNLKYMNVLQYQLVFGVQKSYKQLASWFDIFISYMFPWNVQDHQRLT